MTEGGASSAKKPASGEVDRGDADLSDDDPSADVGPDSGEAGDFSLGAAQGPISTEANEAPSGTTAKPVAGEADASSVDKAGEGAVVPQRSELDIRWRQTRNAPPPVVRAVLANVSVAVVGGIILLLYDWLASNGVLPGEAVALAPVIYVAVVIISGSLLTYLWVELPTGASGERRRSPWAAVLGFFASIPIVYLSLVVIFQMLRPLLP